MDPITAALAAAAAKEAVKAIGKGIGAIDKYSNPVVYRLQRRRDMAAENGGKLLVDDPSKVNTGSGEDENMFDKIGRVVSGDYDMLPEGKLDSILRLLELKKYLPGGVPSDEELKIVSDLKQKVSPQQYIQYILKSGKKIEPRHVKIMLKAFRHPNLKVNTDDAHIWKDSVLNDYMEHIKNYKYHYKDEAQQLDPSIDPKTEHIGPMAQDIEEVNPAAVNADPKTGYKTVDTGRLALMNAGAIAELAREIADIKKRLG